MLSFQVKNDNQHVALLMTQREIVGPAEFALDLEVRMKRANRQDCIRFFDISRLTINNSYLVFSDFKQHNYPPFVDSLKIQSNLDTSKKTHLIRITLEILPQLVILHFYAKKVYIHIKVDHFRWRIFILKHNMSSYQ